ncbi:MAG TPA: photosynthetic reaction center cytochrome c subunit family protein [Terriglobales bacterium]|nr:photosynthetic reaction center cytochrome c subunit family protein [Terriglobales bacterium]
MRLIVATLCVLLLADLSSAQSGDRPKLAEELYKNIQVMKGQPASNVQPVMESITRQIGADCKYCHVDKQWASEDNKMKDSSRMMFRMTAFINHEIFADKERVSCWTCHRGSVKTEHSTIPKEKTPQRIMAEKFITLTPEQEKMPAEQVFKNIQVMKDVPAGKFPFIMSFFARSLGVSCDFCHELPFSSDAKAPKRMARIMLGKLVQGTAKNFYNGETPVECWTCHRGHNKPPVGTGEAPPAEEPAL